MVCIRAEGDFFFFFYLSFFPYFTFFFFDERSHHRPSLRGVSFSEVSPVCRKKGEVWTDGRMYVMYG